MSNVANQRMRAWEYLFLAALAAALFAAAWVESGKNYLGHDELWAAILLQNPHPEQMLSTIAHGGETNPPLYFLIQWVLARIFGSGDFAWRALSALSVAAASGVLFFTVRPAIGPRLAALAVALVMGLSRDVFVYASMGRYYGLFLLLASLAAYYFLKFAAGADARRRDYFAIFLIHTALVYLHLLGGVYSFMLLLAQAAMDRLHRRLPWRLYAAILGAWATFALWLPNLPRQRYPTSAGTWTPRQPLGLFIEDFSLQTPVALVLLLVALLALLAWLSRKPPGACQEAEAGSLDRLPPMLLLALVWMAIPAAIWAKSEISQPLYLRRYFFAGISALVFLVAAILAGCYRLPARRASLKLPLPAWLHDLAFFGVLVLCIGFQPFRAFKNPPKAPAPYVDVDFGHPNLPIAFENAFDFLPRAFYPSGRQYWYLLDKGAEEASTGYYTKLNQRSFAPWQAYYSHTGVIQFTNLTASQFLLVDCPESQVFEYLTNRHPELTVTLLGDWPDKESKVYLVSKPAPAAQRP